MKRTRWKQSFEIFLPGCLLLGWVVPVLAIDLQPGDGTPPKPATRILHLSQQFSERDGFYKNGIKQADSGYRVVNSLLRVGYAFELAKQPAFVYGQLPVGYVHPSGTLAGIKGDSGGATLRWLWLIGLMLIARQKPIWAWRPLFDRADRQLSSGTGLQYGRKPLVFGAASGVAEIVFASGVGDGCA